MCTLRSSGTDSFLCRMALRWETRTQRTLHFEVGEGGRWEHRTVFTLRSSGTDSFCAAWPWGGRWEHRKECTLRSSGIDIFFVQHGLEMGDENREKCLPSGPVEQTVFCAAWPWGGRWALGLSSAQTSSPAVAAAHAGHSDCVPGDYSTSPHIKCWYRYTDLGTGTCTW